MKKETHKCEGIIGLNNSRTIMSNMINRYSDMSCGANAKYFEGDKWYCGKHSPTKIEERENKRYMEWKNKIKQP